MALVLLIVGVLFNLSVALLVVTKRHDRAARYLFAVAFSLIGWQVANFLADGTQGNALLWNRLTFVGPIWILLFSYLFVLNLRRLSMPGRRLLILFVGNLAITVLSLSQLIVRAVSPRMQGEIVVGYNPLYGQAYVLYIVWIAIFVVLYVGIMRIPRILKSTHQRQQIKIIRNGSVIAVAIGLLTNIIVPRLTDTSASSQLAPITSVVFMGSLVYAIFRHGLFDIRAVVARVIAYGISIAALAALYGFVIFGVANKLLGIELSLAAQIFLAVATGVAALSFQTIKATFDRITNQFFYQDAYDAQRLYDELNKSLLANVDVEALSKSAVNIIGDFLKVDHVAIVLRATPYEHQRVIASTARSKEFRDIDYDTISDIGAMMDKRVLVVSELEDTNIKFHSTFSDNRIGVLTKLSSSVGFSTQGIGFLVLSNKRSGNVFSKRDVDVLRVISSELVIAIQNALRFEEIEKFNVTLQQKIDDATKELQRTNEKLKALDEAKDDFISMASHQLRTPLTSIKGYISMILEGDAGDINEQQRSFLNQAFTSSQRMVYLIADLLNVSRLKTGKFIIEASPAYLPELVETEISQLYETAAARGLELRFTKPDSFTMLNLDETKIRQVVMNFTDNAIYYTPKGGTIDVALKETDESVELTVTDTGIGVPKAEQHHLFTKFYRAGNARRARPDGTGLGLFMAKKVILAQGGSIIFRSTEGKGSTFGFTLPKAKLAVPVADEQSG